MATDTELEIAGPDGAVYDLGDLIDKWKALRTGKKLTGAAGKDRLRGTSGNDTILGLGGDDTLLGYGGHNVIEGGAGDDLIYGGPGNDTLGGGKGRDLFLFSENWGAKDIIKDFKPGVDTIALEKSAFTKLPVGAHIKQLDLHRIGSTKKREAYALKKANFVKNKQGKALDRNDYVIYNAKTGALLYDADGSGKKHAAVEIARLRNKPKKVSASDLFVVTEGLAGGK